MRARGEAADVPKPKDLSVCWDGSLRRERWNTFSLKVLTELANAEDVEVEVRVRAKLKEAQTLEQLDDALEEVGLAGRFE